MKALVTGGAGFIGGHLVEKLMAAGWNVSLIDDLSTGSLDNLPRQHEIDCYFNSILGLLPHTVEMLVEASDVVFHLAAIVGVQRVIDRPLETVAQNTACTTLMLKLAAKYKKPILIASSSEVYGRRKEDAPLQETMDLHIGTEPRWGYAAGKLIDEFTAMAHYQQSGLPVVIARLFNTIGPRQVGTYGMVVPRMIDAAMSGNPIQVFGGSQRRAFGWVHDTVNALIALIQEPRAYGQVVNVGREDDVSIMYLAEIVHRTVLKHSGIRSSLETIPFRKAYTQEWGDILHRVPDLSKLKSLVSYAPTITLEEMIEALVLQRIPLPALS